MYSYFANLHEIECASQHYHRTLENLSIWDIIVVSEHVLGQLWACKSVNEFRRPIHNITYRRQRVRDSDRGEEELEDIELGDRE